MSFLLSYMCFDNIICFLFQCHPGLSILVIWNIKIAWRTMMIFTFYLIRCLSSILFCSVLFYFSDYYRHSSNFKMGSWGRWEALCERSDSRKYFCPGWLCGHWLCANCSECISTRKISWPVIQRYKARDACSKRLSGFQIHQQRIFGVFGWRKRFSHFILSSIILFAVVCCWEAWLRDISYFQASDTDSNIL